MTISIQDAQEFFEYKVAQATERGLQDVEAGRFSELTPEYAADMKARFNSLVK